MALSAEQAREAAAAAKAPTPPAGEHARSRGAAAAPMAASSADAQAWPGAPEPGQPTPNASTQPPAPLRRRDVAAVQPDSSTYKATPSPYLSKRQASRDSGKAKKRHSVLIGVTLAALAVAGLGGGAYYVHQQMASRTQQQTTTQYETARITRGEFLDTIDGSTTLVPINTADVAPQVTGTVKTLSVAEGDTVKRGQTLFTLDNPTITAATQTAKSQLDEGQSDVDDKTEQAQDAQDELDELRKSAQDATSKIYSITGITPGTATMNVDTNGDGTPDALDVDGDGKADAFDTDGDGIVDMVDTNGDGTPDTVDTNGDGKADSSSDLPSNLTAQQKADLSSAESALASAQSQLSSAQSAVDAANAALGKAQDTLKTLQDAYDKAQAQEKKLTVTAPIAGTVHGMVSSLSEGGSIDTTDKVCQIDDMSSFTLTIQAPQNKARRAQAGQEARLTFPGIDGLSATTTVDSVATTPTQGTSTYAVSMTLKDPDSRLGVGSSVDVSVVLQQMEDVLVVPTAAIQTQGQDSYLDVLLDPVRGIETKVPVTVVTGNDDNSVVEGDSIQEGNAVVLGRSNG